MLSYQEILNEVKRLPREEQLKLAEELVHGFEPEPETSLQQDRQAAFERLYGILKTDGPAPTDEEIMEDYISYLEKKYS